MNRVPLLPSAKVQEPGVAPTDITPQDQEEVS